MPRIFVDGTTAVAATGTHAMCIATLKLLEEIFPDAEFTILSPHPEVDHRRYGKLGLNLDIVERGKGRGAAARALLRQCSKADVVVGVHGDAFVTRTNLEFLDFIAKMLMVTLPGKPALIFPSSMGPFIGTWRRSLARWVLSRVKLIAAREETTYGYLGEAGIDKPLIALIPDMAFGLPLAPQERLEGILAKEGISDAQRPLIGMHISQSRGLYPSKILSVKQDYGELMARVADYLVTSLNATVMFIPYVIWPKEIGKMKGRTAMVGGDDITAIKEMLKRVQHKDRIVPIETEYDATELKGIIGQCDLFIGAGMHSNIAAISACVPTISIDFRYKTPAMMKMAGLETYYCDLRTVTFAELTGKIDNLWMNRQKVREMLESKVEDFKASIYSFAKSVRGLLDSLAELGR